MTYVSKLERIALQFKEVVECVAQEDKKIRPSYIVIVDKMN
jgi:hypothetical protein